MRAKAVANHWIKVEIACTIMGLIDFTGARRQICYPWHPMEAYCMKCKEKREAKDVEAVTMKNGKPAQQGICPVCGTKMFKIGAAK
jgi:hypothetical protein